MAGMIHDIMPGTEEQLSKMTTGYIGFDPDSRHIGRRCQSSYWSIFKKQGINPLLVGGAKGIVGETQVVK